jgi:hypothetical protein
MRRIVMAQPKLIGWKGDDGSIIRISAGIGSEHDVPMMRRSMRPACRQVYARPRR